MPDQYYTRKPESESRPAECIFSYRGNRLRFTTDAGVFSRGELDMGTRLLLEALPEEMTGEILDLDAYTGGFNLQIAWSTGRAAGKAAAAYAAAHRRSEEA